MSDDLLQLGWFGNPILADACLRTLAKKALDLKGQGAFELDTVAMFVDPVLRGLGWDTLDHNQVDRARAGCDDPDIELYSEDHLGTTKRVAIIEIKRLDTWDAYLRNEASEQLSGYVGTRLKGKCGQPESVLTLKGEPIVCGVVTNGRSWRISDFHGFDGERREPQWEFELTPNADAREFIEALGRPQLLSRLGLSGPQRAAGGG